MKADASDYQNIAPFEDFCTSIGNVKQGATLTSEGFNTPVTTTAVQGTTHVTLSPVGFTIVALKQQQLHRLPLHGMQGLG